jgi:hypothetical protein
MFGWSESAAPQGTETFRMMLKTPATCRRGSVA